jgi:hypothetical protein
MPRLEDDRDPVGELDRREAAEAILTCSTLLTQAQLAAEDGTLDVDAWKEAGMATMLENLRHRIDLILTYLKD